MPSRNNPQGRRRRPSNTSSKSDQGKNPRPKRRTNSPAPPWKRDSTDSGNRDVRSGGPKRNFGSANAQRSRGQQKPPDERRANSSGSASQNSRPDPKSRAPRSPRKEKAPFKARGEGFPSGLRRERPYKKSAESGHPAKDSKPFVKKEGRSKRPFGHENVQPDLKAPTQTGKIRLNRFIANSGVCSRREADELIKMGLISVNGKVITEMGYKVDPGDEVRHESKVLRAERPVYILLNKPKGFLTTTSDPQERNTVMHLIGNKVKERVYPVGRLDRNTTGLLLLTNDGELADKLMHPSYNVKKIYKVELDKPLTKGDAQLILEGVQLDEGKAMVDDLAIISDDKRTVGIEIHIGWNRVVRRIFEALNYEVIKLDRSVYAGLDKKNLGRGEWRFLSKEELVRLKHF